VEGEYDMLIRYLLNLSVDDNGGDERGEKGEGLHCGMWIPGAETRRAKSKECRDEEGARKVAEKEETISAPYISF